jgi:hypothetical protein
MKLIPAGLIILVLLGISGDRPYRAPRFCQVTIRVGQGPRWVSVADVNRDGNPDILVTNADAETVSFLLGDGNGQFREAAGSPFAAGHLPNDIAVAGMNGDGNPDMVIADHQSPYVSILLGTEKAAFGQRRARLSTCIRIRIRTALLWRILTETENRMWRPTAGVRTKSNCCWAMGKADSARRDASLRWGTGRMSGCVQRISIARPP